MSELLLPPPNDDDAPISAAASGETGGGQRRRKAESDAGRRRRSTANKPLTLEEIQERLRSLMGMVAAGWIKPAQANAIARICQLMIQNLQQGGPRQTSSGVPDEILADIARRDPSVLNLLAPFLTDEQFDSILKDNAEDDQNQEASEGDPV